MSNAARTGSGVVVGVVVATGFVDVVGAGCGDVETTCAVVVGASSLVPDASSSDEQPTPATADAATANANHIPGVIRERRSTYSPYPDTPNPNGKRPPKLRRPGP